VNLNDPIDVLARTLYGEARGEGFQGMQAVANTVVNRVNSEIRWWGDSIISCCLAPWQYSCWNKNDPNLSFIQQIDASNRLFQGCIELATKAVAGSLPDLTYGADSYYDKRMPTPPAWADGLTPCASIGHHNFYKVRT
jgi:hypothetical protein